MNSSFNDFIEYVKSFYGYGGLYDQGRSREQILVNLDQKISDKNVLIFKF